MLAERLQSYQVGLADRHLVLDYEEGEALYVDTDERLLAQILDNLLSNAVKYTPVGGRIRIRLHRGPQRRILIENFGVRIPEDIDIWGYDCVDICRMMTPPLPVLHQPGGSVRGPQPRAGAVYRLLLC